MIWRIASVVTIGLLLGGGRSLAEEAAPDVGEPASVQLEQAVTFQGPDGDPVRVPPGTYRLMAYDEELFLQSREGGEPIPLRASTGWHDMDLPHAVAISTPGDEGVHVVALLLPDGRELQAAGTYSELKVRAGPARVLSREEVRAQAKLRIDQLTLEQIQRLQNREPRRPGGIPPNLLLLKEKPNRFARVTLDSLFCIKETGEANEPTVFGGGDEIAIAGAVRAPDGRTAPMMLPWDRNTFKGVRAGNWVFRNIRPRILWQGWLKSGQHVYLHAQVWELDSGVTVKQAAEVIGKQLADPTLYLAAIDVATGVTSASDAESIRKLAEADANVMNTLMTLITGAGKNDLVGSFIVEVWNEDGDLKKHLVPLQGSVIMGWGNYGAVSADGKTVRVMLRRSKPQAYHASLQVRALDVPPAQVPSGDGEALVWKLGGFAPAYPYAY